MQISQRLIVLLLLGFSSACGSDSPGLADTVVEAPGASGTGFGDPSNATNGVRGGGLNAQSLDVYSIPIGSHLVLSWGGREVVDGPGIDLVIYENAFEYADGLTFMDPTIVQVSDDGLSWVALAHDYIAPDETTYSPRAEHWVGFAGVRPVSLHEEERPFDPFEAAAGGDAFDLSEYGIESFRFLRLSSAAAHVNPDTGAPFVRDPVSDGPDIDGVHARYVGGLQ